MVSLLIVTHGDFGAYLVEAAESIVGPQNEGVKNISISSRMSLEQINLLVIKATEELKCEDGIIYFVDMPGGTPMNVVLPIANKIEKSAVICGVNISMVISAFAYRKTLEFNQLVEKILNDGKRSICEVKSLLKDVSEENK